MFLKLIFWIKATKYNTCGSTSGKSLYVGCFEDGFYIRDHAGRDLDGLGLYAINTVGGGSISTCIAYCKSLNFAHAGLQNGLVLFMCFLIIIGLY